MDTRYSFGTNQTLNAYVQEYFDNLISLEGTISKISSFATSSIMEEYLQTILQLFLQRSIDLEWSDINTFLNSSSCRILSLAESLFENSCLKGSGLLSLWSDLFECYPLVQCELLFPTFSRFIRTIFSKIDISTSNKEKLLFLRICNGLLKRISSTMCSNFRGKILMIMSFILPLDERSGVNVKGLYNDRAHEYTIADSDDSFYMNLWHLQNILMNPKSIADDESAFITTVTSIFTVFENNPLTSYEANSSTETNSVSFFPKYLSSPSLLELQLSDYEFRRQILVQCLIILQYLIAAPTFKKKSFVLDISPDRLSLFTSLYDRAFCILDITPHGTQAKQFSDKVRLFLSREDQWSKWKDANCPKISKPCVDLGEPLKLSEGDKNSLKRKNMEEDGSAGMFGGSSSGKPKYGEVIPFGNEYLGSVFRVLPELHSSLENEDRFKCLSSIDEYIEILKEDEEEEDLDEQDKRKNDERFCWRFFRLLSEYDFDLYKRSNGDIDKVIRVLLGKEEDVVDVKEDHVMAVPETDESEIDPKVTSIIVMEEDKKNETPITSNDGEKETANSTIQEIKKNEVKDVNHTDKKQKVVIDRRNISERSTRFETKEPSRNHRDSSRSRDSKRSSK